MESSSTVLKEAVSQDFLPLFFTNQKMALLTNSFLQRYSNSKFEKFDSAQCDTAQSLTFLIS